MPLDAMGASHDLSQFRVGSPAEIVALLRQLADGNVLVHLSTPEGASYTTTVWALDPARGLLCLSADAHDHKLQALLESEEVVAVGYLDSVKLQFDIQDLVLVHGHKASVLSCPAPQTMYRFQRREAFRVRPIIRTSPTARLAHPDAPDKDLALRVIDISIGGCAVFLPEDVPPMRAGTMLPSVHLELDADTRLELTMRLQHVTAINAEARGVRLGLEFKRVGGDALRVLQRYIDLTQKRGKLMALN